MVNKLVYRICLILGLYSCSSEAVGEEWSVERNIVSFPSRGEVYALTLKGQNYPFVTSADYGLFIPENCKQVNGIIVFQHGCGMDMLGITKTHDLQYRAFATKWNLAILETALHGNCQVWTEPSSGSGKAFLEVLKKFAQQTGHPELETVPWLLWGHSAGGHWSLGMLRDYPGRIMAVIAYSAAWDPQWNYLPEVADVPVFLRHAGATDGAPEIKCWSTAVHTFVKLRSMNAPAFIAQNKKQGHNFSFIRYMTIPFFDAVLKQRLIEGSSGKMKKLKETQLYTGDTITLAIHKYVDTDGDKSGLCIFPDKHVATLWQEFVSTGTIVDKTPPPPPYHLQWRQEKDRIIFTWDANCDMESGIKQFRIYKDDVLIATIPEKGEFQTFDTNGDNTSPIVLPEKKLVLSRGKYKLSVETVNRFNLVSKRRSITIN